MAKEQGYGNGIYGPHSSGNLTSDWKRTQLYAGETGPIDHDPLLYTQAQVDALVAAETRRCAETARQAKGDWKAYPEGSICDEIVERIMEGK